MHLILVIVHVVVCLAIIMIVLLQQGKGASMGAAFGGSSQTVFGGAGATTFMHKLTVSVAVLFMITSLGLAFLSGRGGTSSSIMEGMGTTAPATQQAPAPQQPAAPQK